MPGRVAWFYRDEAGRATPVDECPASFLSAESLAAVEDFLVSTALRRMPRDGGYHSWPARLVDTRFLLSRLYARMRQAVDDAT